MKFLVIVVLLAAAVWAYFNIDFANLKTDVQNDTMNAIKNEKTIKKFRESDRQGKQQLDQTLQENFQ